MCKYICKGREMRLGKVITGLFSDNKTGPSTTKGPKLIRCRAAEEV